MSDYLVSPKQHVVDLMSNGTHDLTYFMLCCGIDKFVFTPNHNHVIRECTVNLYREDRLMVTIHCSTRPTFGYVCSSDIIITNAIDHRRDIFAYRAFEGVRRKYYGILPNDYAQFNRHYYAVTSLYPHLLFP